MKKKSLFTFIFITTFVFAGCQSKTTHPETVFVTFVDYDHSILYHVKAPYGSIVTYDGETPYRQPDKELVYTFKGWDRDIYEPIKDNVVFHALYSSEARKYVVSFYNYNNDLLYRTNVEYGKYASYYGQTPQRISDDEHYEYTFSGWNIDPTTYSIEQDTSFMATYRTIEYVLIKFVNYDNSLLYKSRTLFGSNATYSGPVPTRPSNEEDKAYKFSGWDKNLQNLTEDTIFTAQFDRVNRYKVTFKNYDGSVLQEIRVIEGDTAVYTGSTPTRPTSTSGYYTYTYTFSGWDKTLTNVQSSFETTAKYTSSSTYYNATYQNALTNFKNYCTTLDSDGVYKKSFYIKSGSMYEAMYACHDRSSDSCYLHYMMQSGSTSRTNLYLYLPKERPGTYNVYYQYYYGSFNSSGLSFHGYASFSSSFSSSSSITFTQYSNNGTTSVSSNQSVCAGMINSVLSKASSCSFFNASALGFNNY